MPPSMPARTIRRVRLTIGLLALMLLIHLATGENPWSFGSWDRVELGQGVKPRDAMPFVWLASLGNLVLLLVLGLSAPLWLRPTNASELPALAAPAPSDVLVRRVLVGVAMGLLLLQAWPRMSHSLWVDEEYSARRSILGQYEIEPDGRPDWDKLKWRDTFWAYRQPNNHVPFSILSRISTRIADVSRPADDVEIALRMPALVLGLLGLSTIAALATRIGFPWAGVFAAWILTAHPWYLRFASAGRGYSLLLFLLPLYWITAWNVLQRANWRRHAAFGALQFLLMWSYPAVFLLVGITNLWMLFESWRARSDDRPFAVAFTRLGVSALAGAMVFLQVMTPNLIQLSGYMARKTMHFSPRWMRQLGSLFLSGSPLGRSEGNPLHATVAEGIGVLPGIVYAAIVVIVAVLLAGVLRLVLRGGALARFSAVLFLAAPLTLAWAWLSQSFIYHQYLVFGLTSAALLAGIGIGLPFVLLRGRGGQAVSAAIAVALGTLLISVGQPTRRALIDFPISATRDSVLAMRPTLDPNQPANAAILTIGLGGCPRFYDPLCRPVASVEELETMLREADAEGKTLFVSLARRSMQRKRNPEALAFVERDDLFEPVGEFSGFEPDRTRFVRRYRPDTLR